MTPYSLPETEVFELAASDGQPCRIYISKPQSDPPEHGFPVLTVLDGDALFAGFAEVRRVWAIADPVISNSIIAAVGYPDAAPYAHPRRRWDFTPPDPEPLPPEIARVTFYPGGGNDAFARFLTGPLRDELARRYPIDLQRQALFGHSLGGLFALRMLFRQPSAYRAIVAASPAQYWSPKVLRQEEQIFVEQLKRGNGPEPARLLITVGGTEGRLLLEVEALARRLDSYSGVGLYSQIMVYTEELHVTVPSRSVTDTMRFAFRFP